MPRRIAEMPGRKLWSYRWINKLDDPCIEGVIAETVGEVERIAQARGHSPIQLFGPSMIEIDGRWYERDGKTPCRDPWAEWRAEEHAKRTAAATNQRAA